MNSQDKNWLKTAEYLSLSAVLVGTVASGVSQRPILAAAPLSVSLLLNVLNRRRSDERVQKSAQESIRHLHQDFLELNSLFSGNVESLRQQLLSLPTPPEQIDFSSLDNVVESVRSELENRLLELELLDFNPVRQSISELQTEMTQLQSQLHQSQKPLPDLMQDFNPYNNPNYFAQDFDPAKLFEMDILDREATDLNDYGRSPQPQLTGDPAEQNLALLASQLSNLNERQNTLEQEIVVAVRNEIQNALAPLSGVDSHIIHDSIFQLQTEIAHLQNRLQEIVRSPLDLSPLQAQVNQINQRFDQMPLPFDPASLEQSVEDLKTAISHLTEATKNTPPNEDTALVFSAMRSLYDRQNTMEQEVIATVRTEIQNTAASLVTLDSSALHTEIAQLHTEMAQMRHSLQAISQQPSLDLKPLQQVAHSITRLQTEVTHLQTQFQEVARQPSEFKLLQAQVNNGMAQLQTEIAQLHQKLNDATPVPIDLSPLQEQVNDGIFQLQTEIAYLQNKVTDAAPPALDLTPLQAQITQISERFDHLPAPFDPTALEQGIGELKTTIAEWSQAARKPGSSEDSEFLFSAMRSLYERQNALEQEIISAVRSEIQTHLAPLSALDPNAIQTGIAQLQAEVTNLQQKLQVVAQQPPIDLSPLHTQVDHLSQRLEQIPPPFDPSPIEAQVNDLKTTIAQWKQEAESSPLQQDMSVFFSAMRGLYERQNGTS